MADQTIHQRFVKAWCSVKNPPLDKENPHFRNKYASLKATLNVIREACEPHGICYVQTLDRLDDGTLELRSSIVSCDGEEMERSTFPVSDPPNPQAFGSEMTYRKRQQAQADWGIAGDEDDDGNSAAEAAKSAPKQASRASTRPAAKPAPKTGEVGSGGESYGANGDSDKKRDLWRQIGELKAQAVELGIAEAGITSWIAATYKNKDMKEFNLTEVLGVKGYLASLVADKKALEAERGRS